MTKQNKGPYDPISDVFPTVGNVSLKNNHHAWRGATGILGYFRGPAKGTPENPIIEILNEGSYKFVPYYFEIQDPVYIVDGQQRLQTLFVVCSVRRWPPHEMQLMRFLGDDDLTKLPEGVYTLITGYPHENRRL